MSKNQSLTAATTRLFVKASLKHRTDSWLALLNTIGAILTNVAVPFYAGRALASITTHVGNFNHLLLLLIISAIVGLLANRFGFIHVMVLQAKTMKDLNDMAFKRLLERGSSFHNNQISGKLISDAIDFVSSYLSLNTAILITGLPFVATLLVGLTVVALQSWQLGLYVLVVVTVTLVWAYIESRRRRELRMNRLVATKKVTAHLSDTIINAQAVKAFARESQEIEHSRELNTSLMGLRIRDWQRAGRSGNKRVALLLLMLVFLLIIIHRLAETDPNTLGVGIFAFTYTLTLIIRLFDINNMTRQIEESYLQASPIVEILQEPIEIVDVPNAPALKVTDGSLSFDNVAFRYTDSNNDLLVFSNLTIHVAKGEKIGLVGPSGGGKSTLTRLLLRFEDIESGKILIDGQNIAEVTQESLRSHIAYVPQEPLLFHRTIKDNIAYGKSEAIDEEIAEAARKAYALDFIEALPKSFKTVVGERGVKLSGGQRQRIAIARAILKNAPIIVLDEATSALDSESEVVIQKALWELMEGHTAIVIAHRLSTIQKMDRIIVLDEGKIIEQGTHTELLDKKGLYARLWAHQSGGFLEELKTSSEEKSRSSHS